MIESIQVNSPGNNRQPSNVEGIADMERLVDAEKKVWVPFSHVDTAWIKTDSAGALSPAERGEKGAIPGIVFDGSELAYVGFARTRRKIRKPKGKSKPEIYFIAVTDPDSDHPKLEQKILAPSASEPVMLGSLSPDGAGFGSEK